MKHNPHKISPVKDVAILVFSLAAAVFLSIFFSVSWAVSIVLFFLPPAIWLSMKMPERVSHILFFSFMFVGFFIFPVDYIATVNNAWTNTSIFPFRLLGAVPVEDIFWSITIVYLLIMSYEYFFEKDGHADIVGKRRGKQTVLMALIFVAFSLLVASGVPLSLPYAYAVIVFITSLVPLLVFLGYYTELIKPFVLIGAYSFILAVAHEYVALLLGYWAFLGEYIGWVNVGFATIPIEEVIFYFILAGPTTLAYYKFADDRDI